jgi:ribosomal protein S18 acetylase RimI-like enzyme
MTHKSMMDSPLIRPFAPELLQPLLDLAMRAWAPVFPQMQAEIPPYVFQAFYPRGWKRGKGPTSRRSARTLRPKCGSLRSGERVAGFVGLRVHAANRMGEVHIIAVDPELQRQGIGRALLDFSFEWMRKRGLAMAMVETGGDAGHAPSRGL